MMKRKIWVAWLSPIVMAWPVMAVAGEGDSPGSTTSSVASSTSSSSSSSGSGSSSRAQSSVSGQDATVTVNGHKLEVSGGRLQLDGVAHGEVTPAQIVTLRVEDGVVTLLVDGDERPPER